MRFLFERFSLPPEPVNQSLADSAVNKLALIPAWTRSRPLARSRCDLRPALAGQIPFAVSQRLKSPPRRRRIIVRWLETSNARSSSEAQGGIFSGKSPPSPLPLGAH